MSGSGRRGKYEKPLHVSMPFGEAVKRFARTDPKELKAELAEGSGPIPLMEDGATGDHFLVYHGKNGVEVELRVEADTFWATQRQMADAFGVTTQNISLHLQNIFKEGELSESAVCKESLITGTDGKEYQTKIYDLNALISVGYRVGGKSGTQFRIWATGKLLQYLTRGFVIDSDRLKHPGNQDRIAELRETIRDIRASEANVYAELRRICAMCQDYDPAAQESREFYSKMQAKLYWAVMSNTPAMVLKERADSDEPDMGLRIWKGVEITQADAIVAKNYLSARELRELNRLTTILLDIFEDQLDIGKLTLMSEAERLLETQLKNLNRTVLRHGGRVSHTDAEAHAKREYKIFDDRRRALRAEESQRELAALKSVEKSLPKAATTKRR
jgi:hypothetical protein